MARNLWSRVRGLPAPAAHHLALTEQGVTVYWRPGCSSCAILGARVRQYADRAAWVNIWEDPAGAAYVRSVSGGNELVPTVVIDGIPHSNPRPRMVRWALAARTQ